MIPITFFTHNQTRESRSGTLYSLLRTQRAHTMSTCQLYEATLNTTPGSAMLDFLLIALTLSKPGNSLKLAFSPIPARLRQLMTMRYGGLNVSSLGVKCHIGKIPKLNLWHKLSRTRSVQSSPKLVATFQFNGLAVFPFQDPCLLQGLLPFIHSRTFVGPHTHVCLGTP